jgi:2-methylcitrate dehydratase PrpD
LARRSSENAAGPYRKPRANVYTVMLAIALAALLLAIYVLYLEMDDFHFAIKGGPPVTWVSPPAAAVAAVTASGTAKDVFSRRPCPSLSSGRTARLRMSFS